MTGDPGGLEIRQLPNSKELEQLWQKMTVPNGSFAAIGAGPQIILVIPSRGLVLVHQTGTDSVCPFDRRDCGIRYLNDSKVFTLLQMILDAKRR